MLNRIAARTSTRARSAVATAFTSQPEPRTIGSFARGRQFLAGNFQFAGELITDQDGGLWGIYDPTNGTVSAGDVYYLETVGLVGGGIL